MSKFSLIEDKIFLSPSINFIEIHLAKYLFSSFNKLDTRGSKI